MGKLTHVEKGKEHCARANQVVLVNAKHFGQVLAHVATQAGNKAAESTKDFDKTHVAAKCRHERPRCLLVAKLVTVHERQQLWDCFWVRQDGNNLSLASSANVGKGPKQVFANLNMKRAFTVVTMSRSKQKKDDPIRKTIPYLDEKASSVAKMAEM